MAGDSRDHPAAARGRLAGLLLLAEHLQWSDYRDKKYGLWRVAEDNPDSDLYAESSDADAASRAQL